MNLFKQIENTVKAELPPLEFLKTKFIKVTDVDDSPDLTDIHPRDRTDLNLYFIKITDDIFPSTFKLISSEKCITDAVLLGFDKNSNLYPHVDTIELPPYSEINWLSIFIPLKVPSLNPDVVGIKIGNTVYNHSETIIFDTQIPHSAWNKTEDWWISLRLSVLKTYLNL